MLSSLQKLVLNILSGNNRMTLSKRMEVLRNNALNDREKKFQNWRKIKENIWRSLLVREIEMQYFQYY